MFGNAITNVDTIITIRMAEMKIPHITLGITNKSNKNCNVGKILCDSNHGP